MEGGSVTYIDRNSCKIYNGANISRSLIGRNVVVGEDTFIRDAKVSDYVQFNRRNVIDDVTIGCRSYTGANSVIKHAEIGKYASISWNFSLGGGSRHHTDRLSTHPFGQLKQFGLIEENEHISFPKTVVGNDVWIGMDVTMIAGVEIGSGAVIGAGSLVTKDVPPYAIVYGSPASVRRYRFDDKVIELLLKCKWWDWPEEVLREHIGLFNKSLNSEIILTIEDISHKLMADG